MREKLRGYREYFITGSGCDEELHWISVAHARSRIRIIVFSAHSQYNDDNYECWKISVTPSDCFEWDACTRRCCELAWTTATCLHAAINSHDLMFTADYHFKCTEYNLLGLTYAFVRGTHYLDRKTSECFSHSIYFRRCNSADNVYAFR